MNWLALNWLWIPLVLGAIGLLARRRQPALQPCPSRPRANVRPRAKGER